MKKMLLVRFVVGFLIGIAALFIFPAVTMHTPITRVIYTDRLFESVGKSPVSATLLTLLVMGLFGALCMCGTLFYEIERWPLALATLTHYLLISLGYLIPVKILAWDVPLRTLLTIEGCMALGFVIIWLIMYLLYKKDVCDLNRLQKELLNRNRTINESNEEQGGSA